MSKEFTKLNSSHSYRVHYLGPRPLNSLMLHKRYGRSQDKEENMNFSLLKEKGFKHYQVNLKKIINCNFTNVKFMWTRNECNKIATIGLLFSTALSRGWTQLYQPSNNFCLIVLSRVVILTVWSRLSQINSIFSWELIQIQEDTLAGIILA